MRRLAQFATAGLLSAVLLLLTSCSGGRGVDAAPVEAATRAFLAAIHNGQGGVACRLLSPGAIREVQQSERKPCAQAITSVRLKASGGIQRTAVYVRTAEIHLTNSVMFLSPFNGRWKIYAAGCTATSYPPYDCAVQGG